MKPKRKVLISNMAWLQKKDFSDVELFQLKKALRVMPRVMDEEGQQSIEMYRETDDLIGVPRVYFRSTFDPRLCDITYDICQGRRLPRNSNEITLRSEDQEPFVRDMIDSLTVGNWGCGIGEAYTGFGKSVTGIKIAELLAVNTFILVHNEEIKEVWVNALKKFYPNASIGIIQGQECDYEKDFVIGMCQSIMNDEGKYPQEMYRHFGLVFVDEVHRFGSRAFGRVAPKFNSRYIFGLSGTVRRQDECEVVFHWTIGDIVTRSTEENRVMPLVWFRDTKIEVPFKTENYKDVFGKVRTRRIMESVSRWNRPRLLRYLSSHEGRQRLIAGDVIACLKKNRNPLLVAERKDVLYSISNMISKLAADDPELKDRQITHGFFFGGETDKKRSRAMLDAASRCTIVYATLQKGKEGVDIVRLDCLFLVTPNTDTEQVSGRICRPTVKNIDGQMVNQSRIQPIVFDYVDTGLSICRSSYQQRLDLYSRLNWKLLDLHKIHFGD